MTGGAAGATLRGMVDVTAKNPPRDPRTLLSALWVFAMFNYVYGDIVSLMDPALLPGFMAGQVGSIRMTPAFLFGAAVMMEVPVAMTLLARLLPPRPNRYANLFAAAFKTLVVVATLFVDAPAAYYAFFSAVEIVTTVAIFVVALRWSVVA